MPISKADIALSRRVFLTASTSAAASLFIPGSAQAAQAIGQVAWAQGTTTLERGASILAAIPGGEIFARDRAVTGDQPSRLDLRLGAATRIRLGANASLEIDRFIAGLAAAAALKSGPALIERDPGAEPHFILTSPFALLAARGTAFFAGPSKGVFGVFVREGVVIVRTRRHAVTLRAGEGTDIKAPGRRPSRPKAWGQARIDEAMASVV
jgi:ferric-dicitrate binding protein FerR (iron transport regulator)